MIQFDTEELFLIQSAFDANLLGLPKPINITNRAMQNFLSKIDPTTIRYFATLVHVQDEENYSLSGKVMANYDELLLNDIEKSSSLNQLLKSRYGFKTDLKGYMKYPITNAIDAQKSILFELVFEDTINNVLLLYKELDSFYSDENARKTLTKDEKAPFDILMEFRTNLQKLSGQSIDPLRELIKNYYPEKIKIQNAMYDAKKIARLKTAQRINDTETDLETLPKHIQDGVTIYSAKNSKYSFLINLNKYAQLNSDYEDIALELSSARGHQISLSRVTNEAIKTFKNLKKCIAFGYSNIPATKFINTSCRDNYNEFNLQLNRVSDATEFFGSPKDYEKIAKEKGFYNEFNVLNIQLDDSDKAELIQQFGKESYDAIMRDYSNLQPSFVFCLDDPLPIHIQIAKKMNLPIVVADGKNYKYFGEDDENPEKFDRTI